MSESTPEAAARELLDRHCLNETTRDYIAPGIARLLVEWRLMGRSDEIDGAADRVERMLDEMRAAEEKLFVAGEREGMERAARVADKWADEPEVFQDFSEKSATLPVLRASRFAAGIAEEIRAEAASLGTLKEPASGCQKAPSREAEAPTRGPEAPSGFKSGASPQSETLRSMARFDADIARAEAVRAAEQKVLALVEKWRDEGGPTSICRSLVAAVDELRSARAKS